MKAGRNDPCPCGSGRKYKKCCLTTEAPLAYGPADCQTALDRLDRFCERDELEVQRKLATDEFWVDLDAAGVALPDDEHVGTTSHDAFEDWFLFDRKGPGSLTPAEAFLRHAGDRLASGEREFIARLCHAELRLYEVVEPVPGGAGLGLVDLRSGERQLVPGAAELASDLERGEVLAARLMPGPDGATVLEGALLVYPESTGPEIAALLRRAWRPGEPEAPQAVSFKTAAPVLHAIWMRKMVSPPAEDPDGAPRDRSPDCAHAVFDVLDSGALEAALTAHPDLADSGDGLFAWRESTGEQVTELGHVEIDGEELVVHTTSPDLARRARRMIEDLAGAAVRFAWAEPPLDERREIPVDWTALQAAFESGSAEWRCYLDLRTGRTHMIAEGSGGDEGSGLSGEEIEDLDAEGHLIVIEPLEASTEHDWMSEFAASVADGRVRHRLRTALGGRGALRRFKDVLAAHPDVREQWHARRRERLYAAMRAWLEENDIAPTTQAPDWLRPPGGEEG